MLWLKTCPKCKGDLVDDRDWYGECVFCVQCGYYLPDHEIDVLKGRAPRKPVVRPEPAPLPSRRKRAA